MISQKSQDNCIEFEIFLTVLSQKLKIAIIRQQSHFNVHVLEL